MGNAYERLRLGIEFMTAYASGNDMLFSYVNERRREDPMAAEHLLDGTAALCALLLRKVARDTDRAEHEILQEVARGSHRHEQSSGD
ncbi:hypothetical protein ACWGNN_17410 [Streptomyces sp. NPDC055817]